jgi:hypothetical protein
MSGLEARKQNHRNQDFEPHPHAVKYVEWRRAADYITKYQFRVFVARLPDSGIYNTSSQISAGELGKESAPSTNFARIERKVKQCQIPLPVQEPVDSGSLLYC